MLLIVVIALGGANRIIYKIMTTPMGSYSFFLGVFNGLAYVLLYGAILFVRVCTGKVPVEQLKYTWGCRSKESLDVPSPVSFWGRLPPIKYFIIMGFMDGLGNILGLIAAPNIDGVLISLLSQTIVIFSIICSLLILRARYTYWQLFSAMLVLIGGIISLAPQFVHGINAKLLFSIITAVSTLPNAISFTLKELVFKEREKEGMDLFIVNSHGSLFQLIFQPLFIPLCIVLGVTNGISLDQYIADGMRCFVGITPEGLAPNTCQYSLITYLIYIVINLTFNILLLLLVKKATSLLSFMALKAILPISVVLFLIPWPIIGPSTISWAEITSLIVILIGLALYRATTYLKDSYKLGCCSCFLPFCETNIKLVNNMNGFLLSVMNIEIAAL